MVLIKHTRNRLFNELNAKKCVILQSTLESR